MYIEVYINEQHLHTFSADMLGVFDYTNFMEFTSLEQRAEYRNEIAGVFIQKVVYQLLINNISNYSLYIVFPSKYFDDEKPTENP